MNDFYTDVICLDHRFHTTDIVSDILLLEPVFRKDVLDIIAEAKVKFGVTLTPFETYRSKERQEQLFVTKATKLEKVGVHHYGLAVDIVPLINGKPSWDWDFKKLGMLAHEKGIVWGGDWGRPDIKHDFVDPDHVQRITLHDQNKLFDGSWYPDANYKI